MPDINALWKSLCSCSECVVFRSGDSRQRAPMITHYSIESYSHIGSEIWRYIHRPYQKKIKTRHCTVVVRQNDRGLLDTGE